MVHVIEYIVSSLQSIFDLGLVRPVDTELVEWKGLTAHINAFFSLFIADARLMPQAHPTELN